MPGVVYATAPSFRNRSSIGPWAKQPLVSQVAFLFLVVDAIATEPVWAAFIASAAELKLREAVPPTQPSPPPLLPHLTPISANATCESTGDNYLSAMRRRSGPVGATPPKQHPKRPHIPTNYQTCCNHVDRYTSTLQRTAHPA